jgi:hypothetical protein
MYGQQYAPNPYTGATPQMQQRLNYLQQMQMYQQPQMPMGQMPQALKGRVVTGMDEAKAAQIDLDGSSTFFPCPAEGKIYEKSIDLNGLPVFRVYQLANSQEQKQPVYAERNSVDKLAERVDKLEKQLQGGTYHEPDANNGNVTE